MKNIKYEYHNMPIGGGGYVTGFEYDREQSGLLYIRTDIGGSYRFDYNDNTWHSLIDGVTEDDLSETYPLAIASKNGVLYIVCGDGESGKLCVSRDFGETFEYFEIPARVHGNSSGRGTGSRLVVGENVIYFASSLDGLLKSVDSGRKWTECDINNEKNMTFVWLSDDDKTVIAGTSGTANVNGKLRGSTMYVSYNNGERFEEMKQPENIIVDNFEVHCGAVAHRISSDEKNVYVTLNYPLRKLYYSELNYSCDCGQVFCGMVLKYTLNSNNKFDDFKIITPKYNDYFENSKLCRYGFGGISSECGKLLVSTIGADEETIYLSNDGGDTWKIILRGTENIEFGIPYMKPINNENRSFVHWMSDVKINPHNSNEAWFNTGSGVFRCDNISSDKPMFYDQCSGLEETVHLNVYSLPTGETRVIDIVGDLGGFAFNDIDKYCDNTFADDMHKRYITCINADFPDKNTQLILATARGNWVGTTKGGVIISHNGGHTFYRPPAPFGLSERIDSLLHEIEKPNVNAGWVAVSADGKCVVWCICDRADLPSDSVVFSTDLCETYGISRFWNDDNSEFGGRVKVFSDRCNSDTFYAFGNNGEFFVSNDNGANFKRCNANLPKTDFASIHNLKKLAIQPDCGKSGVFYISAVGSLYKLEYKSGECIVKKLTDDKVRANCVGLGLISEDADYFNSEKMLYINGWINGEYGFYRSSDDGKSWSRINNSSQMFGEINSIAGDSREFGLFYLATGSRGLIYGRPTL